MIMKKSAKRTMGTIFGAIVGIALLGGLYAQAITSIMSGNYIGGSNYYGQPVGPYLQLLLGE